MNDPLNNHSIKKHIRDFKDFPKKGIIFRDIMPLFTNPPLFRETIDALCERIKKISECDAVVGIESRGFLIGAPLALHLEKSFVAARKKGKLPGDVVKKTYALEYGEDAIEIQKCSISPNAHYIIVDDLLATGGTAAASASLIKEYGGTVSGFIFLIELCDLKGREKLQKEFPDVPCESIVVY